VAHLHGPAAGVGAQRGLAACGRQPVETRLGEAQQDAFGHRLEFEGDQGGGFHGVVHARLDRIGVPAPGEHAHRLDALDVQRERRAGMRRLQLRDLGVDLGGLDRAGDRLAGDEGAVQRHAEPCAERAGVGQRVPHPFQRGMQQDVLLDAISRRAHGVLDGNRKVA